MNIFWGKALLLIGILIAASGCGDSASKTESDSSANDKNLGQEHVLKQQTDALDKAKNLDKVLLDAQAERVKQLDDETP